MANGDRILSGKINFHVKKYLEACERKGSTPSVDTVVFHLVNTYGEYQRKPQGALKKIVAKAVDQYSERSSKRQKLDQDSEDEEAFAMEEEKRNASVGGNLLNSSLRSNYANKATAVAKKTKKKPKASTEGFLVTRPTARYSDIGGIDAVLDEVRQLIEFPLTHPEIYAHLGVEPPRGILLHGPPGTGKTQLANAIAGESGAAFLSISAPEIVSGMSGESEQKLRTLFDEAIENAPAIIFIDEIDAITPKRETSQRGMEKRIVAQLLTSTDSLCLENTNGKPVLIIGATNMPDSLDPALRRAGRFDREISLGIPDEAARVHILGILCKKMKLSGDFDFKLVARRTSGFVGADLVSLTKEAAAVAVNRIFSHLLTDTKENSTREPFTADQLEPLSVTMDDFLSAVSKVQPSSKREGFATIPDVTWNDVGALSQVREDLKLSILHPILHPERFEQLGLNMPAGVLLYGPPGCGKTLLAKAIANESGANFISVKGPELLDKYVGESERAVRQVFQRARASSPCIVFFDELDALCPRRGSGSDSGSGVSERVVNQLLTEMDGLEARRSIFVIAATNRPDIIDPAMLRPGRLDKLLYVPLPESDDRQAILKTLTTKIAIGADVNLQQIAKDPRCEGLSGADLSALVREAGIAALRACDFATQTTGPLAINNEHFNQALGTVLPSVSRSDQRIYNRMRGNLRKSRANLGNPEETPPAVK